MVYYPINWKQLHTDVFNLAQKIESSNKQFDILVGLSRGGLTIGHMFSDFLSLPVTILGIASYRTFEQREKPKITTPLALETVEGKDILLVDDVSDTGNTLSVSIEYLNKAPVKSITTATVYIKPKTKVVPDFYEKSVKDWIVFPFDVRETIEDLVTVAAQKGGNKEHIKQTLKELHFDDQFIDYYCK